MMDLNKVQQAIEEYDNGLFDDLIQIAEDTFVFGTILTISGMLRKKAIAQELYALGRAVIPKKLTPDDLDELDPIVRETANDKFVTDYKNNLLNGGRYVNKAILGNKGEDGIIPYLGYNREWVPWADQFKQSHREELYSILTSGKPISEIKADLQAHFDTLDNYTDLIARTEVLNNSEIIQHNKWVDEGFDKFLWVCSSQPNSPCVELCMQFCGQIYDKDNIPFGGELVHPRCRCSRHAVVSQHNASDWDDLPVAESSDFMRDIRAQATDASRIT